jgi:hypothetical protein
MKVFSGSSVSLNPFVLLLVVGIAACTGAEAPDQGFGAGVEAVHDSAGVRIVVSAPAQAGSMLPWHIESEPFLRIGEVDGDPELLFTSIMSVAAQDGVIAVADQMTRDLRLFTMEGVPSARVQQIEASGPGGIGFPRVFPDAATGGFVLVDAIGAIGGVLDPAGQVTRVFRWETSEAGFERGQPVAWTGRALVLWSQTEEGAAGVQRSGGVAEQRTRWARVTPGDPVPSVWDRATRVPIHYVPLGRPGASSPPRMVGVRTPLAQSLPHLTARGDQVYKTSRNGTEVLLLDSDGEMLARYRIGGGERTVTMEDIDREARAFAGRASYPPQDTEAYVEQARSVPPADVLPRFSAVMAGPGGEVWARNVNVDAVAGAGSEWTVFDATGVARGRIAVPSAVTLFQVEEDWILGTVQDATGVPRVVVHALHRRSDP